MCIRDRHKSNELKIFFDVLGNLAHLLNDFAVNLALMMARGILDSLACKIRLGQISESTKKILSGLHKFKNFFTKKLTSNGKNLC